MDTALMVLRYITVALAGLEWVSNTDLLGDSKAAEIVGKIPGMGLPIAAELQELKVRIEALIAKGDITAEDLEEINQRATEAEGRLLAVLIAKTRETPLPAPVEG